MTDTEKFERLCRDLEEAVDSIGDFPENAHVTEVQWRQHSIDAVADVFWDHSTTAIEFAEEFSTRYTPEECDEWGPWEYVQERVGEEHLIKLHEQAFGG
jgi:hypothetical protein